VHAHFAEFINLLSSESNEVCSREEKKTIAPEHVLKALSVSLFSQIITLLQRVNTRTEMRLFILAVVFFGGGVGWGSSFSFF
jgi:hypothetical protein